MVCGMFVCVSLSINVSMFTVSNALLMSNATAMVRVGGMGWLKPVATVLLMLCKKKSWWRCLGTWEVTSLAFDGVSASKTLLCISIMGSNDSRLHVVEPPRGKSFIWQIGVNSSIQDRRQVDRGFLWSRVSRTRQR